MDNKAALYGVGGVLLGLVGGVAVGGAVNVGKMEKAINRTLVPAHEAADASSGATQEALTALQDRLAALETAVTGSAIDPEALSASVGEQTQGLASQLDEMQQQLGDQIAQAGQAQSDAMKSALADLSDGMGESARIAASAVAAAVGEGGGGEAASAPMAADGAELSAALGVGQTAVFADGALRAFVSRLDEAGGSARLTVNGETVTLGVGGTHPVTVAENDCSISIMGLTSEGVTLGSDCGGAAADAEDEGADAPAAEDGAAEAEGEETEAGDAGADDAEGAETESAEGDTAEAPKADTAATDAAMENAVSPGNTVRFADGALRAYLSAVDEAGQMARVAINGIGQTNMAVGDTVEVPSGEQSCTLTLAGLSEGKAGFSGSCD